MNDHTGLDRRLANWLDQEAPAHAPARLVHATRARLALTEQARPLGRLRPTMPRWITGLPLAARLAAVAMLLVALAGLSLYQRTSSVGVPPAATPSPTPVPTLTSFAPYTCPTNAGTCHGALAPGVYQMTSFVPKIRFSVPAGWTNTRDVRGQYDLTFAAGGQYRYPDGTTFHDALSFFRRPVAESADRQTPLQGVGTSAHDLASWLGGHVDLVASAPTAVTIGGAPGYMLEISLPTRPRTAPDHCTSDHGDPRCESLFISDDASAEYGFGIVGPESAVIYLLDAPSGDTVMVVIDDVDGVDKAGLVAAATPIVESLTFAP